MFRSMSSLSERGGDLRRRIRRCNDAFPLGDSWDSSAFLLLYDDWGGWYDHEPPTVLGSIQGGYQYGFRVPLIAVSPYTPRGYIDNNRHDFGSSKRSGKLERCDVFDRSCRRQSRRLIFDSIFASSRLCGRRFHRQKIILY